MKRKNCFSKKIVSAILAVFFACGAFRNLIAFAGTEDAILFPDAALKQALVGAGADTNTDGEITEGELSALMGPLSLSGLDITDLSGMEYAVGVESIDLSNNRIRDIAPLAGLTLSSLDVSNNYLDLSAESDDMAVIDAFTTSGCSVVYTPQKDIPVEEITLNKSTIELCPGDSETLTAVIVPEDAANKSVTWASSDETIATVSEGVVTAVAIGEATITATTEDGSFFDECEVAVKSAKIETDTYVIDGVYLTNVSKLSSPGQVKANLKNDVENIKICNSTGTEITNGSVGTGMTVVLTVGGTVRDTLTILIKGDTNGDGMISVIDYTLIRLDILGLKPLEGTYRMAADTSGDEAVSIIDYTLIRLDILNLKSITGFAPDLPEVADPQIRAFLNVALAQQGKPYVWAEEGPDSFDCSGYIYYCLTQVGYSVYRATASTYSQWASWQYVDRDDLQPGDLMFYRDDDDPTRIGHIGIYLGNGYHIHASSSYDCIIICKIDGWYDETLSHGRRVW